jgi:hypothetical protein
MTISELWIRKDLEGSASDLFQGTILPFTWREWGIPQQSSVRPARIWTRHFSEDRLETSRLTSSCPAHYGSYGKNYSWVAFRSLGVCKAVPMNNETPRHKDVGRKEGTTPCILNLGNILMWVTSFTRRLLSPRGKSPRYPLDRSLCGPQVRSARRGGKHLLPLPEIEPRLSCPARRYTSSFPSTLVIYWSCQYQDYTASECGAVSGMIIDRGNRSTRRKPAPMPICPPQIPPALTRDRTRVTVLGSRQLTVTIPTELAIPAPVSVC